MKKNWKILSLIGVSGALMVTSGLTALASSSGYDAYKSAFKNTHTLTSATVNASLVLKDNGSSLVTANSTGKADLANKAESGSVTIGSNGNEQTLDVYRQNNQTVFKSSSSDVFFVQPAKAGRYGRHDKLDGNRIPQEVENIIDALVGNLKDNVTFTDKPDGVKEVSLTLSDSQIPAVANAVGSLLIKHAADGKAHPGEKGLPNVDLKQSLPKLTQDITIKQLDLKADINASNYIQHQEANIVVSGKDADGASHEVAVQLNADLSDINATKPDTVDLTGKTTKTIQHQRNREAAQADK